MVDLFSLIITPEQAQKQFTALRKSALHPGARDLINATFNEMGDPDGNFVRDFQGDGFHTRLFELCCFSYLRAAGFQLSPRHKQPDFIASRDGQDVAIEVTTANPTDGTDRDISLMRMEELDDEEVHRRASEEFPKRMMRSLRKKLRKRYQELPQAKGKPLVLMTAPNFEAAAGAYVDESLVPALYPLASANPAAAFFAHPDAASISAIAFCNAFRVSKFWRIADRDLIATACDALCWGVAYVEGRRDPLRFEYRVGDADVPPESWAEGVTLFLNPHAEIPLPDGLLPASSTYTSDAVGPYRLVKGFHPMTLHTFFSVKADGLDTPRQT